MSSLVGVSRPGKRAERAELVRLFGGFQAVGALFHVRRSVLATEWTHASAADHERHPHTVVFFTDITILGAFGFGHEFPSLMMVQFE
jgi:hypothetical protein